MKAILHHHIGIAKNIFKMLHRNGDDQSNADMAKYLNKKDYWTHRDELFDKYSVEYVHKKYSNLNQQIQITDVLKILKNKNIIQDWIENMIEKRTVTIVVLLS